MFDTGFYSSRYFNKVYEDNGLITKASTNIDKIKAEFDYYYYLPNNLKRFFVQPFDFEIKDNVASYKMEIIKYPNLAELSSKDKINKKSFELILNGIDNFKSFNIDSIEEDVKRESEYLVLEKTKTRISSYKEYSDLFNLIEKGFNKYIKERQFWNKSVSHGDLCFSNIFWIDDLKMIKFIDPRGAIKNTDIFMDEYYDLAKISHSIFGGYESIIYNKKIDYSSIHDVFIEYLNRKSISINLLKIYEASLFLSMIPLHSENKKNMNLFANTCAKILSEVKIND